MSEEKTNLVPSMEEVEKSIVSLEQSMLEYDHATNETQELRRALVAKLMPAVMKLDLNVDASSDPDLVASQSRVIEQARQLLNDIDSSAKNHVNVKLKKSDIENNHQSNMEIAKLLQKIKIDVMNPNDPNRPLVQSEEELNKLLEKNERIKFTQIILSAASTSGICVSIFSNKKISIAQKQIWKNKTDEEIVIEAKNNNSLAQEFIISKYENFVKAKAKSYFLIGADKEDIYQEGMIGLYKAIRDFNPDKLTSFRAFAEICVTRQIITAIKTATRQKHIPLNTYVSLNKPIFEEESERTLLDVLASLKITDPEELVISEEQMEYIQSEIKNVLSDLEQEVLKSYLDGKSYQEIACDLDRHAKSIDNALQRVKRKLEKCLNIKDA